MDRREEQVPLLAREVSGRKTVRDRALLGGLVRVVEAASVAFSLCEVSNGVHLVGAPLEGVGAFLVLAGALHMQGAAGVVRMASADTLLLLPAGTELSMIAGTRTPTVRVDGSRCIRRRNGILVVDATGGRKSDLTVAAARVTGSTPDDLVEPCALALAGPAAHQLLAILRTEIGRHEASGAVIASLMSACVALALREAVDARPGPRRSDYRDASISRAASAVIARPADPHSVDSLAVTAGMSRSTFVRQFARVMKCSPMAFVQQTRLKEAATILRSSQLPIQAVAAATGFASRTHFSRAFRSAFGSDPSEFRHSGQNDGPN